MRNKTLYNTAVKSIQALDHAKTTLQTVRSEINKFKVASAYGVDGLQDVINAISKTIQNIPLLLANILISGSATLITAVASLDSLNTTLDEYRTKGAIPHYKKQELLRMITSSIQEIDNVMPDLIKQRDENHDTEESSQGTCPIS